MIKGKNQISKKKQFNIYLTIANKSYFLGGSAYDLDVLLTFMRTNNLSYNDLFQILNLKSNVSVYYKIKNVLLEVDKFLDSEVNLSRSKK